MPSFRERLRAVRPGSRPEDASTSSSAADDEATVVIGPEAVVLPPEDPGPQLVEAGPPPAAVVRAARRERAALEQQLDRIREDLGGLIVEMARRNRFNHPLLERRAMEAVAVERAMADLEARVAAAGQERRPIDVDEPEPVDAVAEVTARCARCGAGLVGDVNFCGYCGAPRGTG